ncbi:MAG: nucleoside deaminase [Rhodospirillaceae bacterium]|jgi:guanine deaminase|nr:nucleoside deaminase [Rhodospirillaceae bacterium]MBT6118164.1 nucleoside deaminase [Rhodospirillaceae bacterium]
MACDHDVSRKGFLRGLAAAVAGSGAAAFLGASRPARSATGEFCDEYDPAVTRMEAIPWGKPYEGDPEPISAKPLFGYVQPWNGFDPECTIQNREECHLLPSQTANIKVAGVYDGIEVGGNRWMEMAAEEALLSVRNGGGPFGAVILQIDDQSNHVIRYWRNHNHVPDWHDPTAHAEVSTIRAAARELGVFDLGNIAKGQSKMSQPGARSHCVIYSSAEPCPMCYSAIYWARIPRLIFAATRYDAAAQGVDFSDEALYRELGQPYAERQGVKASQSTVPNSLDAFNLWKRKTKTSY